MPALQDGHQGACTKRVPSKNLSLQPQARSQFRLARQLGGPIAVLFCVDERARSISPVARCRRSASASASWRRCMMRSTPFATTDDMRLALPELLIIEGARCQKGGALKLQRGPRGGQRDDNGRVAALHR
jgi:hypothetical protein